MRPPTPEQLAKIRAIVNRTADPYWSGYLAAIKDHQPPETPGATSCPKETP